MRNFVSLVSDTTSRKGEEKEEEWERNAASPSNGLPDSNGPRPCPDQMVLLVQVTSCFTRSNGDGPVLRVTGDVSAKSKVGWLGWLKLVPPGG